MAGTASATAAAMDNNGALVSIDLMEKILHLLPAIPFASAACTCRLWNSLCSRILYSKPKLLSASSTNPNPTAAIDEVVNEVLSEPIRPHFVLAFLCRNLSLQKTHEILVRRFGATVPIITCYASGTIGRDVRTKEVREVEWVDAESIESLDPSAEEGCGLALTVGFLPGMKIVGMSARHAKGDCDPVLLISQFAEGIRDYSDSVSGCPYPSGVVMFIDPESDMREFLQMLDDALCSGTPVAGCVPNRYSEGCFLFSGGTNPSGVHNLSYSSTSSSKNDQPRRQAKLNVFYDVVALIFAKDRDNSNVMGDIQIDLAISNGLSPVGPTYRAASVRYREDEISGCTTWMTARRDGFQNLDGQALLEDLENEVEFQRANDAIYIGLNTRRKSHKYGKPVFVPSFSLHEISDADDEYLYVHGGGIKTGNTFQFYAPDLETAHKSHQCILEKFNQLKQAATQKGSPLEQHRRVRAGPEVFGGLMFACIARGESFFSKPNFESSPFVQSFPAAPLAGLFCLGELGPHTFELADGKNKKLSCSILNKYSTVFLVFKYHPATP